MNSQQRTICNPVQCSGVGVHSGKNVSLTIKPAPVNHGIKFIRTDLPGQPGIASCFNAVVDTSLATVIGHDGVIVSTVEHLMAAFAGLTIDNAIVELDAYEIPILDGSAACFTDLIVASGIQDQSGSKYFFKVEKPIELEEDGKFVGIYPASSFKITCTIEYDHSLIQKQSYSIELSDSGFKNEISRARTFGFLHEYEYLKQYGLARGASLNSGVVLDRNKVVNKDGLRFQDEFVRHKILDCIGDFSLLGMPIQGHVVTHKSGHAFNHAFLRTFLEQKKSWVTCSTDTFDEQYVQELKTLAI